MRPWEADLNTGIHSIHRGRRAVQSAVTLSSKLGNMQAPEQNGRGSGEAMPSIALSLPHTQQAQRELRVSKQQVRHNLQDGSSSYNAKYPCTVSRGRCLAGGACAGAKVPPISRQNSSIRRAM